MKSQVAAVVNSKRSPFTDNSAFLRWAIMRGLRYFADIKLDKGVTNMQAIANVMVMRHQQQHALTFYKKTIEDLAEIVRALETDGHRGKAKEMVQAALRDVSAIDDRVWRNHWIAEVRRRYSYLLKK